MTDRDTRTGHPEGGAESPPEELDLRAKPARITRINRMVLFGVVFIGLLFLAGLVIVALNPPRFTAKAPSELYNVDQKAVTDALNKLPSSYEGLNLPRAAPRAAQGAAGPATAAAPFGVDSASELEQAERVRVARLATQARESGVFFRLQLKAAPHREGGTDAKTIGEVNTTAVASAHQPSDRAALTGLRRVTTDDDSLGPDPAPSSRPDSSPASTRTCRDS